MIHWRKSSHSQGGGGECVEVAHLDTGSVGVRDSTNPAAGHLDITPDALTDLIDRVKAGDLDLA